MIWVSLKNEYSTKVIAQSRAEHFSIRLVKQTCHGKSKMCITYDDNKITIIYLRESIEIYNNNLMTKPIDKRTCFGNEVRDLVMRRACEGKVDDWVYCSTLGVKG